ncbi:G-type lectin S-receptor-like serine/threonine-protein kinase At4g27290 [Castanea sativa]|uniref:G-type lectin S-receptor-like serine/threonine-protein kinase At4g27290 n=1 Tax=Castanea sativa TaxID=21020 RepID=UPI003F6548E8
MPLKHTSGALKLADQRALVLLDEANNTIWSSNSSRSATNPSFDHPSDTLIPGMKYGNNSVTCLNHLLTSWKSTDDPLRAFQLDRSQSWSLYSTVPVDECETYAFCGAFSSCNIKNSPLCGCLRGFVPKSPQDWNATDWSNGCVRKTPLDCGDGDGFLKYSGFKLPDTRMSWHNRTMDLKECNNICVKNCSCTGYATLDIRGGGSGCILWFGELIDIRA